MLSLDVLKRALMPKLLEKDQSFFKENFTNFYGMMSATGLYLVFQTKDKVQLALPIANKDTYFDAMENRGESLGIPLYKD